MHVWDILKSNTADRYQRKVTDYIADPSNAVEPDDRIWIFLCLSRKDRAYRKIVNRQVDGFDGLFDRMRRIADYRLFAQQLSRFDRRKVILSYVYAVSFSGDRDVYSVIHDQLHSELVRDL